MKVREFSVMGDTVQQYNQAVESCRVIFIDKTRDYGTSWRVLRTISVIDQIFIKAQRIRTLQEKTSQRINDNIGDEFMGIVNYGVIGLIQLQSPPASPDELPLQEATKRYDEQIAHAKGVMMDKNHDYGEAWRSMSQHSFVDLILMKLHRAKQINANAGKTLVSEGIDANFTDIVNYALFALILIGEGKHLY